MHGVKNPIKCGLKAYTGPMTCLVLFGWGEWFSLAGSVLGQSRRDPFSSIRRLGTTSVISTLFKYYIPSFFTQLFFCIFWDPHKVYIHIYIYIYY